MTLSGCILEYLLTTLKSHDEATVPARKIGGGKLKPIEDAPGSYVKVRSWT